MDREGSRLQSTGLQESHSSATEQQTVAKTLHCPCTGLGFDP